MGEKKGKSNETKSFFTAAEKRERFAPTLDSLLPR
jgi:hypothetical protein